MVWEPREVWHEAQNLGVSWTLWKKRDMVTGSDLELTSDLDEMVQQC